MQRKALQFFVVPAWAMPEKPFKNAIFEVAALAGFQGQWVRMTAGYQSAILGANVFGKQEFRVNEDGTITVRRSACFGTDYEAADYEAGYIHSAAQARKKLSPGVSGADYYHPERDNPTE